MTVDVPPMTPHSHDPLPTPWTLWFALIAPPLAWAAQGLIGWWISSATCADGTPQWGSLSAASVRMLLIVISVAALVISLAALLNAYRAWTARRQPDENLPVFTKEYRLGFMAMAGMIVSGIFTGAIVLIGIAVSTVSVCEYMR